MPATDAVDLAAAAARLAACVREAGLLALSMFGTPINNWTKAGSSPVSDADIAVDRLLRERLIDGDFGLWLAVGGKRRRSGPARRALRLDRRSDRRHTRLSGRPAGLDHRRRASREWPADRGLPLRSRHRGIFRGDGRRRRYVQWCGDLHHARRRAGARSHRRSEAFPRAISGGGSALYRHAAGALPRASPRPRGPGRLRRCHRRR